jgi:hypothetical protein
MVTALRRMTPTQRLARAHAMWRFGRERAEAAIRTQHPDWNEGQVQAAVRRRMLGPS